LGQPAPQRVPGCRADITPVHQSVIIHVVERDLLPMHVKPAYHRHQWDLLELLKHSSDAHIIERLRRGGPHHMSSFVFAVQPLSSRSGSRDPLVLTHQDTSLTFEDMSVIRGTALSNYPRLVHELGKDAFELLRAAGIRPDDVGNSDVFIPFRGAITA